MENGSMFIINRLLIGMRKFSMNFPYHHFNVYEYLNIAKRIFRH